MTTIAHTGRDNANMASMEKLDQQILGLLTRDGRMSYTDIGHETGLSTSAAQQRVRRLEQRGIIRGYRAILNPVELGRTLTAFISVRSLNGSEDKRILDFLTSVTEIVSCFSVAGTASYLCLVEVGTTAELDALLTRMRDTASLITETTVVLRTVFRDRSPIES